MPRSGRFSVSVLGGSGYVGGELIRLLLKHPDLTVTQVISRSQRGRYVSGVHPNLRGHTTLRFVDLDDLSPADFMFSALPHGAFASHRDLLKGMADRWVDLSADHRISDPTLRAMFYGEKDGDSAGYVYGLPELNRERIREATRVSGAGCLATAAILGLLPLAKAGWLGAGPIVMEAKVGSSAAGVRPKASTHHPERQGVLRSFAPTGHRHTAEIVEQLGQIRDEPLRVSDVLLSATAVELVRGVLVTAHCPLPETVGDRDLWAIFRSAYDGEPFVRIVKERRGLYRYPEPKLLSGTNVCEVGFEIDPHARRVVVMSALDNLVKGAAGNGVQAMNLMLGLEEDAGLDWIGLHP